MAVDPSDELRTAEVIGALCLATDLAMGFPLEHGLHSTQIAMRIADRLDLDEQTRRQTFYGCLLFYAGCTTDAETAAELFTTGALLEHFTPVVFGSPGELARGIFRALGDPRRPAPLRVVQGVTRLPGAVRGHQQHITAMCEVAEMLADRLGVPTDVRDLFGVVTARWDGKGVPRGLGGEDLPIALRVVHVARDAAFHRLLGGPEHARRVIQDRAGGAFDPLVAAVVVNPGTGTLDVADGGSAWGDTLCSEPGTPLVLHGDEVDRALAAVGDFADLASSYFLAHSSSVARLAAEAAGRLGLGDTDVATVRRAGLVHDVGRVAVDVGVWTKPGPLTADEWERVRLHAHHTERILSRSEALSDLAVVAGAHHESLDGSGYHRGLTGPALNRLQRMLAAADCYRTLVEPRPHRPALAPSEAALELGRRAGTGRLDPEAVGAVLEAAGQRVPRMARPAGLTEREVEVLVHLARGLQTKQVAHRLGISAKTADRHIQNAYAKIGVSTRAAATLFVMQHGLTSWGELRIPDLSGPS